MEHLHQTLSEQEVIQWFESNLPVEDYRNKSILLIVPDATRTAPLPLLFSTFHRMLSPVAKRIDVLVAPGTHPPMPENDICGRRGISEADKQAEYRDGGLFNQ